MTFNERINLLGQKGFEDAIKLGKRSNEIAGYEIESLINCSYWFLKTKLPHLISEGKFIELILAILKEHGYNVFEYEITNLDHKYILYFLCFITDELKSIKELEEEYLKSEPDAELLSAGIDELNVLGELNIIDSLANGDVLKYDSVKKLKYADVFDKQLMTLINSRIQKKIQNNRKRNNKK